MMSPNALIVEDDPAVVTAMVEALEEAGFEACVAEDGDAALQALEALPIDLVLLDLRLPGADGFEVCREIRRRSEVPVVIVTARSDASGIVAGLDLGADDYIIKPFEASVLVARARAVLRRYGDDAPRTRDARDLSIDEAAFVATKQGGPLALTTIEMRLLVELVRNQGRLMSRQDLLEGVWGYGYLGDSRLVDMAIKRLRDKLGEPPSEQPYIATVRGAGYRFEADPSAEETSAEPPG
jgi:two-component system response regulator MtrA